jgi:hypothetical protein
MNSLSKSFGVALALGLSALTGAQAVPFNTSIAASWTGFMDPNERGFSTQVPSDWWVSGGLVRHTALDPGIYMRLLSPDRRTYLMIGDPAITLFRPLIVTIFAQRMPEGGAVLNYLPGVAFARAYVAREITKLCGNVVVTGQRERPDLAQGPWTRFNPQSRHDGGEVTFTCRHGTEQAHGIVTAATYMTPGNALWGVDFLAGYITPPEGEAAAFSVIRQIIASMRIDPTWLRNQTEATMGAANMINARTTQMIQMSEQHLAAARERQAQFDRQFESFDRIINGISPYADAAGNVYNLDNTRPYHWIGPGGQTVATFGPAAPGIGWQPLREVPPR